VEHCLAGVLGKELDGGAQALGGVASLPHPARDSGSWPPGFAAKGAGMEICMQEARGSWV
jgi:hypothetical protein